MQNSMEQKQNRFQKEWNRTNTKYPVSTQDAGFHEYAYRKKFHINLEGKKKVLVAGAGSYIGEAFEQWALSRYRGQFHIDTVDMRDDRWKEKDFRGYDCVLYVAGIAHADIGNISSKEKAKYYRINTELSIKTAEKCKEDGVKQFIFMSSLIIYGDSARYGKEKVIDEHTIPSPANFYGDSKWRADKGVRELSSEAFKVAVLRLPMVYGKGCKGNFVILERLAKKIPVFPKVNNRRSMIYINNLCEFLCKLILSGEGGIFFPQNAEYVKTVDMVRGINEYAGNKIRLTNLLNPMIAIASFVPGKTGKLVNKAFGNIIYAKRLSIYKGLDYQETDFQTSLKQISKKNKDTISSIAPSLASDLPVISVVTICYNSADLLGKTIESVLHQTYDKIEYIIIDGASQDDSVSIAKKYYTQFKERGYTYTIISEPDKGIYDAMNKGIEQSSGELIGFINAGDWYEKEAVGTVAMEYWNCPFDYFYADVNIVRANGSIIVKHSKQDYFPTSRHWNHPTNFCRKQVYEEIGGFKCKGIHDDFEFFLRVRKAGKNIRIARKVLANFQMGGISNRKSVEMCKRRIQDRYRGYRENGYSPFYFFECVGIEVVKYFVS